MGSTHPCFLSCVDLSVLPTAFFSEFPEAKDTLAGARRKPRRPTRNSAFTSSAVAQPASPPNSAPEPTRTLVIVLSGCFTHHRSSRTLRKPSAPGYRSLRLCMSHNRMVLNLAYIWESLDKLLKLRSPFLPYCDFIGSRYSPSTGVFESLLVILLLGSHS